MMQCVSIIFFFKHHGRVGLNYTTCGGVGRAFTARLYVQPQASINNSKTFFLNYLLELELDSRITRTSGSQPLE